jgi:adenosylcobinamide kinase/adenosylcobinamide-phosphate guanylyltransferase
VDIGHLWLDGVPVKPYFEKALPRTRVIHLHGIGERDHSSLSHVDSAEMDALFRTLLAGYRGVLTLELFSQPDFLSSIEVIQHSMEHVQRNSKLTFILGGARSGKSTYAQKLAQEHGGQVLYVATATAGDDEMKTRIEAHRAERPANWQTLEAPLKVGETIERFLSEHKAEVILLDCITLLATNVILQLPENVDQKEADEAVKNEVDALIACINRSDAQWIVVSNEVGLGLVPPYPLGRLYRDALGRANQQLASCADRVILMVAGVPMNIQ